MNNVDRILLLAVGVCIAIDAFSNFKLANTIQEYKDSYDNLNNMVAAQKLIREVNKDESSFD